MSSSRLLVLAALLGPASVISASPQAVDGILTPIRSHAKPSVVARVWFYEQIVDTETRINRNYLFELPAPLRASLTAIVVHGDFDSFVSATYATQGLGQDEVMVSVTDLGVAKFPLHEGGAFLFAFEFSGLSSSDYEVKFLSASNTDLLGVAVPSNFAAASAVLRIESLTIYPAALPLLQVGRYLLHTFTTPAEDGASAWTISGGKLPPGLTLSRKGLLSGTIPASAGEATYGFTIQATDGAGTQVSKSFSSYVDDLGPLLRRVSFRDTDRSLHVGAGDELVIEFNEDVVIENAWLSAIGLLKAGDSLGASPSIAYGATRKVLVVQLGSGAVLGSLGGATAFCVANNVANGILDVQGNMAQGARACVEQNVTGHLEFGELIVGQAITPVVWCAPPFLPRRIDVDELPDGLTFSCTLAAGAVISGAATTAGRGTAFVYEDIAGKAVKIAELNYEVLLQPLPVER